MTTEMNCDICEDRLAFQWSDTHGVGVCGNCGAPYTIYHYDDDGKRLDKPPELCLKDSGVALARRFRDEVGGRVFPAAFDMGISRGDRTYSGASQSDIDRWNDWYRKQPEANDSKTAEG